MSAFSLSTARQTLSKERHGLEYLEKALDGTLGKAFNRSIEYILATTGHVIVTGIGKSGLIGRKIQSTLTSTGTAALFLHPAEASHGDLGIIRPNDLILALSNSGESVELTSIIKYATQHSVPLISITSSVTSSLAKASKLCLVLPPATEACPLGLAPTTSSLMLLALGDALAISLMEQRKFTAYNFSQLHPAGRIGTRLNPIKELMHTGHSMPLGLSTLPLRSVIIEMTQKAFGCMGVLNQDGTLSGLIADGDLRRALKQDLDSTTAADIMNNSPLTTSPDALVQDVLHLMHNRDVPVSSIFILDNTKRPVGILHLHDFLQAGVL